MKYYPNTATNQLGHVDLVGGISATTATFSSDITAQKIYDSGQRVLTSIQVTAGAGLSGGGVINATTNSTILTNTGVLSLVAGTDTSINTTTGAIIVWSTATLQSITNRSSTTTNAINISNGTASTSTTTGALTVAGGVGVGGNLNVLGNISGTNVYSGGNLALTAVRPIAGSGIAITNLTTSNGVVSFIIQNTGGGGTGTNTGSALTILGTPYLGVDTEISTVTLTNLGVQTLTAGTDTAVSGSTGTLAVWSTATLQSITNRGSTTSNYINISNTSNTTLTTTGAFTVAGSIGVAGNLNIGGTMNIATIQASTNVIIGNSDYSYFTSGVIASGGTVNLDTFNVTQYRTAKYLVQAVDYGFTPHKVHSAELLVIHDDNGSSTIGYVSQYGIISNTGELGTWDATYATGSLTLTFTPNYTPTSMIIKVNRIVLTT